MRRVAADLSAGVPLWRIGVLYGVDTHLIANRIKNVGPAEITWNAREWDVQ